METAVGHGGGEDRDGHGGGEDRDGHGDGSEWSGMQGRDPWREEERIAGCRRSRSSSRRRMEGEGIVRWYACQW